MEQEVLELRDKVARLEAAAKEGRVSKQGLEALELEMETLRRELERAKDQYSDTSRCQPELAPAEHRMQRPF